MFQEVISPIRWKFYLHANSSIRIHALGTLKNQLNEMLKISSFKSRVEYQPVSLPLVKRIKRMTRQMFPPMIPVRNNIRKDRYGLKSLGITEQINNEFLSEWIKKTNPNGLFFLT